MKLSLKKNDTPGIRLEQDNTGGFAPQTWDIAGNEANFFVRDLTGGSKLPFRIRPGRPDQLDRHRRQQATSASGRRSPGVSPRRHPVRRTVGAPVGRLLNDGTSLLRFENKHGVTTVNKWDVGNAADKTFTFTPDGTTPTMTLTPGGDATAAGALEQSADPAETENGAKVDEADVLAKLRTLPVKKSELTADPTNAIHLGPTGADFRAAFGLGSSDGTIAPADSRRSRSSGFRRSPTRSRPSSRRTSTTCATASARSRPRSRREHRHDQRPDRPARHASGAAPRTSESASSRKANKALAKRLVSLEKKMKGLSKNR